MNKARYGEASRWVAQARANTKAGRPRYEGLTDEQRDAVRAVYRDYDRQRQARLRDDKRLASVGRVRQPGEPPPGAPPYLTAETAPRSIGGKA